MVEIDEIGTGEPDDSAFGDPMGEGRVRLSSTPVGLEDDIIQRRVIETDDLRDEIDPTAIQRRRSDAAREADRAKDAEVTTDPLKWASNPDEYDYPGVDTGPTFRENFDERDFDDF
jgi:hypothetical protein